MPVDEKSFARFKQEREQLTIAGAPTTARTMNYPYIPLVQTKDKKAEIDHKTYTALQYEIYIPAKVWTHRAVLAFINNLEQNGIPGATILKTAAGRWDGIEEDTNIYRTIVYPKEENGKVGIKKWLQDRLGEMMAILAEWGESRQQVVLFTETELIASESVLITPPLPPAPREPTALTDAEENEQEQ